MISVHCYLFCALRFNFHYFYAVIIGMVLDFLCLNIILLKKLYLNLIYFVTLSLENLKSDFCLLFERKHLIYFIFETFIGFLNYLFVCHID